MITMTPIDAFFAAQKAFQEEFDISECLMAEVVDLREFPWDGTDWTIDWKDSELGWMGQCMNVQHEAIEKNGLTLYLAENNGNVSWMVFDDAKRVDSSEELV